MTVIAIMLGEGMAVLAPRRRDVPLRLIGSHAFPDGAIRLHCDVEAT